MANIDIGQRAKPNRGHKKSKRFFAPALGAFAMVAVVISLLGIVSAAIEIFEGRDAGLMELLWSLSAFGGAVLMGTVYEIAELVRSMSEKDGV